MIKRYTFENGFQVVYQKSEQSTPLTCIYVFCNVGSAFEINGIRGASHLVEHMCFKGTQTRIKAHDLLVQYNKIGASYNAYTEKRFTTYTLTCDDNHVQHCMHLMSDMLLHSSFPRKEFAKEQHVVVEENIKTNDKDEYMLEKALDLQYFRGSSYEHPIDIIDYHPSPTYLKYEDMYQWYKWFYRPSNMVLSVISNLSFDAILKCIRHSEFIIERPLSVAPIHLYPTVQIQPITEHFVYRAKNSLAATILHVGFRTCDAYSKDKYVLQLLKHVLNGFSGRLFTTFRSTHGLTYHSSAHTTYHEHAGTFSIELQTDPTKLLYNPIDKKDGRGVIPILVELISNLIQHGVTQTELEIAKGNCKGKTLLYIQSMDTLAEYNGINTLLGIHDANYIKVYDNYITPITCKQINNVIRKYMTYENLMVGIVHKNAIPKNKIESLFQHIKW
jgi:predicted Zn-dependent peptidase